MYYAAYLTSVIASGSHGKSQYIRGFGVLNQLGDAAKEYGTRALVVAGEGHSTVQGKVEASCSCRGWTTA